MRNILITTVSIMALSAGASFAGTSLHQLEPHQHAKGRILYELNHSPLSLAYGNQSLLLQWSSNNTATVDQSASLGRGSASAIVQGHGAGFNEATVTQSGIGNASQEIGADNLSYIWQRRDMRGRRINTATVTQTNDYRHNNYSPNYSVILQNWGHDNDGNVTQTGAGNEAFIRQNGGASNNGSTIKQTGQINSAYSRQTHSDTSLITQWGFSNDSYVNQLGDTNDATVWQGGAYILSDILQTGSENTAGVHQSGDFDASWVTQSGDNNMADVIQANASAASYVVQSGYGNTTTVTQ